MKAQPLPYPATHCRTCGQALQLPTRADAVLMFACDGLPHEWALTQAQIDEWADLYPSLDVLAEMRKAWAWLAAVPTRKKTAGGMRKCLVGWLNRATNGGHGPVTSARALPGQIPMRTWECKGCGYEWQARFPGACPRCA